MSQETRHTDTEEKEQEIATHNDLKGFAREDDDDVIDLNLFCDLSFTTTTTKIW